MAHRILVVDDDPHIRDVISFALQKAGLVTETVADGAAALDSFRRKVPDLIVLDIGMPFADGLEVCRHVRKTSDVPILFLSARDDEIDRVLGLEIGGDDYVTKPFSPRELVARVNAILRRVANAGSLAAGETTAVLSHGVLRLFPHEHRAEVNHNVLTLTAVEFAILKTLLARPLMVFSREQIMSAAYAPNINVSDRTIDSHIRNIRAKVARCGCDSVVETVHGVGFRIGRCADRS